MLRHYDTRGEPNGRRGLIGFIGLATLPGSVAIILISTGLAVRAEKADRISKSYDGNWSVEVVTERGPCDHAYRHKIVIENGKARYSGSDFVVSGASDRTGPSGP